MARMAYTVARAQHWARPISVELALVPMEGEADAQEWSIDREAMGSNWYESSWLLRRGLEVDENPPPETIPPEWQWKWWAEAGDRRVPDEIDGCTL